MKLPGKLRQLAGLPLSQWAEYITALAGRSSGIYPCAFPGVGKIGRIPKTEYFASYIFFVETVQGRREIGSFLSRLRKGDTLFDIGAFRGAYGVAARLAMDAAVSVHFFEPLAENAPALRAVLALNGFDDSPVIQKAVGDGTQLPGFFDSESNMLKPMQGASGQSAAYPFISVDEYCAQTGVIPSLLKIDVEGYELDVLKGALTCLQTHKPRIWLELHPDFLAARGLAADTALEILRSIGYRTEYFMDHDLPSHRNGFHVWCEV